MLAPGGADYSIATVSKLTGVSCHTLRVWERRYGFPAPDRLASGHRRYSKEQVAVLRDVAARVQAGGTVGDLLSRHRDGRNNALPATTGRSPDSPTALVVVELLAVGDSAGADAVLDRFQERMSPLEMIEEIIEPVLIEIGERAFRRESRFFQENLAGFCVLNRLHRLYDQARRINRAARRRVLIGGVEGGHHEGSYLMVCLALELAGWRTIPLGADVPVSLLDDAVEAWKPDALALMFAQSRHVNKRFAELAQIRSLPVFVGGRSIVNHLGLARRMGLLPLSGPLSSAIAQLILDSERWHQDRLRGSATGSQARRLRSSSPLTRKRLDSE